MHIKTLNANNSYDFENIVNNATDFWDRNDNIWFASEHWRDLGATDIHWAMEKSLDYWQSKHNRNSINNEGIDVNCYFHYGTNSDNAFWLNSKKALFFGDGGVSFRNLSSVDVCAHELGHGICLFTSNLFYGYGTESSALNEGFSDIWGACIEAYAAPGKQKWLIGEEITLANPGYLRSMNNPPSGAFKPSPDTYGDLNWINDADAHFRSGVLNKWFFLLSEGGSAVNGIGNTYNVMGISIEKAEKIAYRTELLLNSNANYSMARTMSIQAAQELYGAGSCEEIAVTRAWYAVGVGANYTGAQTPVTITGPDAICPSGSYKLNNIAPNASVNWTVSNPSIASVTPAPNGLSAQVFANINSQNSITVTAQVSSGCNFTPATASKTVYTGPASFSNLSYSNGRQNGLPIAIYNPNTSSIINNVCIGYNSNYYIDFAAIPGSTVSFTKPPYATNNGFQFSQSGNRLYFWFGYTGATTGYIRATVANNCGATTYDFAFRQVNCGTTTNPCDMIDPFVVSPNPSSGLIKINTAPKPTPFECPLWYNLYASKSGITFNQINVYNQIGTMVQTQKFISTKEGTIELPVNLPNGTYRVEIIYDETHKVTKSIVIQH